MQSWTYHNYIESIESDVKFGVDERGYSAGEAIGFAHSELALRLEKFPEETPMALIAVAAHAIQMGTFDEFAQDEFFMSELDEAIHPESVASVVRTLPRAELGKFSEDLTTIKRALGRL